MREFRIYIVRQDRSREEQIDRFTTTKAAFEAAFALADELANNPGTGGASPARFIDVYEEDRLCIGIGVGQGPHLSR